MIRQTIVGFAFFLLGLIGGMAAVSYSQGMRLEGSVGQCSAKGQGQGQWWSGGGDAFTAAPLRAACYQVGLSQLLRGSAIGWRASWVDLGSLNLDESAWGGRYPDGTLGPQPHWTANGSGSVHGATFGGIAEKRFGSVIASAEGGAFLYRSKWSTVATHYSSNVEVDASPSANYGAALYYGVGVGYRTKQVTLEATFRAYPKISFNTVADNFDTVGASSASVNAVMVAARWVF